MIVQAICFYLFAAVAIASGVMVITARNPVHSVLFLILAFFNAAGLFVLLGRRVPGDDPGHRLCRRSRGAVPVRRDDAGHRFQSASRGRVQYLPIGATVGIILAVELVLVFGAWVIRDPRWVNRWRRRSRARMSPIPPRWAILLYTKYAYAFQASGVILLIAMIGAIVLTLRHKPDVRRQNIGVQVSRRRAETIALVKVKQGEGIGDEQGVR